MIYGWMERGSVLTGTLLDSGLLRLIVSPGFALCLAFPIAHARLTCLFDPGKNLSFAGRSDLAACAILPGLGF